VSTNVDISKKAHGNASGNTGTKANMHLNSNSNIDSDVEDKAMDMAAREGAHTLELGTARAIADIEPFALETLEFSLIKEELKQYCVSNLGKRLCDKMLPETDRNRILTAQKETTEAAALVSKGGQPLLGLHDISEILSLAKIGGVIQPRNLVVVADMLRGASKFKKYMKGRENEMPLLCAYAASISDFSGLVETITGSIDGDRVSDYADPELRKARRSIANTEARIQSKMNSIISSPGLRDAIQEGFVTVKSGRYVIPVKASQRQKVSGTLVQASSSGMTVFIEPAQVQPLVDELVTLRALEEDLVYKVLAGLTAMVFEREREIRITVEAMACCDFALAKGRYSLEIGGVEPSIFTEPFLNLISARHPLLGKDAVPVDIRLGRGYRTLVVTGPNTGGKTVLLKTAGLLCLMAQAGLHIPAQQGSGAPAFAHILADIGDRQSIQQSLSTFSSHMSNISRILGAVDARSLVLLDEIGTGTDPREGAALAAGILEFLYSKGCLTMATTHYGDIKAYSEAHPGFENGCMEFDHETLKPLYRLVIGESGQSQGLIVARRLGIPEDVIQQAEDYIQWMSGPDAENELPAVQAVWNRKHDEQNTCDTAIPQKSKAVTDSGGTEDSGIPEGSRIPEGSGINEDSEFPEGSRITKDSGITRDSECTEDSRGSEGPGDIEVPREKQLLVGDSVWVNTVNYRGVVAREPDERGNLIVLVRKKRIKVHSKRVKLLAKREDLYPDPENYDLNIVLLSKEDRKAIKQMSKRHTDKVRVIEPDPE
jgi:DNA mismatch repair protein MutS2